MAVENGTAAAGDPASALVSAWVILTAITLSHIMSIQIAAESAYGAMATGYPVAFDAGAETQAGFCHSGSDFCVAVPA
jgi:hypothetical protein